MSRVYQSTVLGWDSSEGASFFVDLKIVIKGGLHIATLLPVCCYLEIAFNFKNAFLPILEAEWNEQRQSILAFNFKSPQIYIDL